MEARGELDARLAHHHCRGAIRIHPKVVAVGLGAVVCVHRGCDARHVRRFCSVIFGPHQNEIGKVSSDRDALCQRRSEGQSQQRDVFVIPPDNEGSD